MTKDKRKCIKPCVKDPFPEDPNGPEPPAEA